MNFFRSVLLALTLLGIAATPSHGQLQLWVGGAYTEALGGQWGGDARLAYNFVALPLEVFGGGDYFVTECEESCSLRGWRVGGNLRFPIPGLTPYVSGAWVWRDWEVGVAKPKKEGLALGAGVSLEFGIRIQAEASREFLGGELDKLMFRVALGF